MKKQFLEGIYFGLGLFLILGVIGTVAAIGFHAASEILPGTFSGNYNFVGGNVGIGTNSPENSLDVRGMVQIETITGNANLRIATNSLDSTIQFRNATDNINWELRDNNGVFQLNRGQEINPTIIVTQNQNIGIGIINPTQLLHLSKTTTSGEELLLLEGNGGWDASMSLKSDTKEWQITSYGSNDGFPGSFRIKDVNQGFNRLVIDATSGNVGIGTNTPQSPLQVGTPASGGNSYIQMDAESGGPASAHCDEDSERGKMILDYSNNRVYFCNGAARGWDYIDLIN